MASVIAADEASRGLGSSTPGLPLAQFLGRPTLVGAQLRHDATTPGSMRVTSRSAFFPV